MKPENFKTFNELPEDTKGKYKPINKKGAFVEKTAIENPEVAHRLALLENEAFGDLSENIKQSNLSAEQIVEKLSLGGLNYDEQKKLEDLLRQHADLARLKGRPIDDQLTDFMKKKYIYPGYSKILTAKLTAGIEPGDVKVIGELFKDERFHDEYALFAKLADDQQRVETFKICRKRLTAACKIIEKIEDLNLAIKMYAKTLKSADMESYSDKSSLESTGKKIAELLFKAGNTKRIIDLVKNKTLTLASCKSFLHQLGSEPKTLMNLGKYSTEPNDIYYLFKFIAEPKLLNQLKADEKSFPGLTEEQREKVTKYAKNVAKALSTDPEIKPLTKLIKDETSDYNRKEAKNKFVVGVADGKYYIAWSNVDSCEYHRNIFEYLPPLGAKSGGYIGLDESDGKTMIRMTRSSGDYKFYSHEVMEHFRKQIEAELKKTYVDNFELQINISDDYGE